jgi:hypothetical protein
LQSIYKIKDSGVLTFFLGANYIGSPEGTWYITAKQYIKEAILQVEKKLELMLREEKTPIKTDDHLEEDSTPLLNNILHREYQSLIGMLQWAVMLCRVDICYTVSSMSRFYAVPREGHLTRVLRIWGYLKKYPDRAISINNTSPEDEEEITQKTIIDFASQYSYAKEEVDSGPIFRGMRPEEPT